MLMASCKNCCHFQTQASCELGLKPDSGDLLCKKYAMTIGFREELLRLLRADVQKEVNRAVLGVQLKRAEESQAFAG